MSDLDEVEQLEAEIASRRTQLDKLLIKMTAENNSKFEAMTDAEKRAHIAWDTIQQIEKGWITVESGTYLDYNDESYKPGMKCTACALGSLFAACIAKPELKIDFDDSTADDDDWMREALGDYFSEHQLRLIETAFERDDFTGSETYDEDSEAQRAIDFGRHLDNDKDRLVAILNNVITNKGTFIP